MRRVVVEKVQPTYALDNLYPSLAAYAETYQQCGQSYAMAGTTFWGDMHAAFTIDANGEINPGSFKATYPGDAYMRPFLNCASTAFKKLTFPPPKDQAAVSIEVLIQVLSQSR